MTAWELVARTWPWEPSVVCGCGLLIGGYLVAVRLRPTRAAPWFFAGVVVLLLALDSPLDTLGDTYLFSAHMTQHLLLLLIVPPLLLLGIPSSLLEPAWRWPLVRLGTRGLGHPAAAWMLGIGTIWLWHLPVLYNTALEHGGIHIVQHLTFLATGAIFWWPVLAPVATARLSPLPAVLYLLAAALASSVLGIILTFTPVGLYPAYLLPLDGFGVRSLLRGWGMSPETDQQLGGLLMWIPGGLVYLCAILGTLVRWFADEPATDGSTNGENHDAWPTTPAFPPVQGRESHVG